MNPPSAAKSTSDRGCRGDKMGESVLQSVL